VNTAILMKLRVLAASDSTLDIKPGPPSPLFEQSFFLFISVLVVSLQYLPGWEAGGMKLPAGLHADMKTAADLH
jgi:hypothetical protein